MFIKPDYNLKNIYEINLEELKNQGINALLFDLDSTLMGSKTGYYTAETLSWLEKVKQDFFVGVVSNNNNPVYIEKVTACSDFPVVFEAHKPDIKVAKSFMEKHNIKAETTCFVGDRPLTDVLCGKNLGCKTILVDSITADIEKPIVRFARKLERCFIKH
ncbi:MAG TPA: YqeG family HAD IIIA-type phosphatase [Candidatus Stercorousia faecigallinarum]|nr:YqeG family HAD IIIA-type phosphatase [Candidatus Stercorousia faecigallinarum]